MDDRGAKTPGNSIASTPNKEPQVYRELSYQDSQIESLASTVEKLLERLGPVLGLSEDKPGKPEIATPGLVPIAEKIYLHTGRLAYLNGALRETLSRLEI